MKEQPRVASDYSRSIKDFTEEQKKLYYEHHQRDKRRSEVKRKYDPKWRQKQQQGHCQSGKEETFSRTVITRRLLEYDRTDSPRQFVI